ncbi:MerR family DNA-binding protein, partial [Candidatus Bipolaricaulota bacterium]|nr:MerR family DNA-binding protein [Candidatus Bipolaricaulota bacterium]
LYSMSDPEQLRQVMLYRELGFRLERIRGLMSDPTADRQQALMSQRGDLEKQRIRLTAMLDLTDRAMPAIEVGERKQPEDMFGDFDPTESNEDVRVRWSVHGNTVSRPAARRRTRRRIGR